MDCIISATKSDSSWFSTVYATHRAELLMKIERTKMAESQDAARAYLSALSVRAQFFHLLLTPDLRDNVDICILEYGKGWEGINFMTGDSDGTNSRRKKNFSVGCPAPNCLGFVDEEWTCNLCSCNVCPDCREMKRLRQEHKCDPQIVASIKAVFREAKPCPKCASLISKISGCDQMFCSACHTTFSWLTGNLIKGFVHNPHYFQWLDEVRKKAAIEVLNDNANRCEEYITFERLKRCFKTQDIEHSKIVRKNLPRVNNIYDPLPSTVHYYLAFHHLRDNIVHVRATSGNHANVQEVDNHDLRVQLLVGEIDEVKMKETLEKRHLQYHRSMGYCSVYMIVYQASLIVFDNLFAFMCERKKQYTQGKTSEQFMHECYLQLMQLLKMANDCIEYNDKIYGVDERFIKFTRHPYS